MKIFLDTADTEQIKKYFETGLVDGVTTNPSLIRKSGRDPNEVYREIRDIGITDISMEVVLLKKCISAMQLDAEFKELLMK